MAPNSKLNAKRKAAREAAKPKPSKKPEKQHGNQIPAQPQLPFELQQLLLNIFRNAFAERLQTDIEPLVQEVKGHLYNRDFATAFGKESYLEAYAARWSPSRALGYADVLWTLRHHFLHGPTDHSLAAGSDGDSKDWKVLSLGGGAGAEVVALAGLQHFLLKDDTIRAYTKRLVVDAIDIADWRAVVERLQEHITSLPPLSKYASAAAKATNAALLDDSSVSISFSKCDVLEDSTKITNLRLADANLVTILFTLNELYSTSLPSTQRLLFNLTSSMKPGSLLLVIDSPGSYSTITLNETEKQYPMQWLLDHTLLKQVNDNQKERGKEEVAKWEKIEEDESKWFRMPEGLKYPIELENMRMQLHLYRRLEESEET